MSTTRQRPNLAPSKLPVSLARNGLPFPHCPQRSHGETQGFPATPDLLKGRRMPRSARTEKKVTPIRIHAPTPVPELESPAPQPLAANKLLLTPQEAADALSINRTTLYALLMRGEIRSILIGRARRIPVQVLEEWIAGKLAA